MGTLSKSSWDEWNLDSMKNLSQMHMGIDYKDLVVGKCTRH